MEQIQIPTFSFFLLKSHFLTMPLCECAQVSRGMRGCVQVHVSMHGSMHVCAHVCKMNFHNIYCRLES